MFLKNPWNNDLFEARAMTEVDLLTLSKRFDEVDTAFMGFQKPTDRTTVTR